MSVSNNFRPRELWTGPLPELPAIPLQLRRARSLGIKIPQFHSGDALDWAGTRVRGLSPPPDYVLKDKVKIRRQNRGVLLEGEVKKKWKRGSPQSILGRPPAGNLVASRQTPHG